MDEFFRNFGRIYFWLILAGGFSGFLLAALNWKRFWAWLKSWFWGW